jgi:hypothetical protein
MITVIDGFQVKLECFLLIGSSNIKWTWNTTAIMNLTDSNVLIQSTNESTSLTLQPSVINNRGTYYCQASNAYGNYSRYINLRVKSNSF